MKFKNKKTGEVINWDCVCINSALLSAQNRKRLYWTNWEFGQLEDKHIMLKDIVHEYNQIDHNKVICLNEYVVPFDKTLQILDKEVERGKVGYFGKDSQANRIYHIHDKAVTLWVQQAVERLKWDSICLVV